VTEPSFSVIIPAYNEAELVGSAIESVLRQSRPDWEAIVVDDGSSDGTADAVREFEQRDPRIRLLQKQNEGLSAARNSGIDVARAPYLSFLDSDDLLMPGYLDAMGSALDAASDAGFAYTDAWAMDAASHRIGRTTAMSAWTPAEDPAGDPMDMIRQLIPNNFIFVATTVPRAVFDRVGRFDPELSSAEDYDMWLRILSRGYTAVRPPGVLAIKRERSDAMSANYLKMLTNLCEVYRRIASDTDFPDDIRDAAEGRIDVFERRRQGLLGRRPTSRVMIGLRRALTAVSQAVLRRRRWPSRPPREVAEAFPDLERL
jgi:glycosyltransferase involved in cell wall biosynthesis